MSRSAWQSADRHDDATSTECTAAERGKVLTEPRAGDNRRAAETAKFYLKALLALTVLPKLARALSGEEDLH